MVETDRPLIRVRRERGNAATIVVKPDFERYGLPYNTGPLGKQWGTVQRTIIGLPFPGGGPRPKPDPYVMPEQEKAAREQQREMVPAFP